MNRDTATHKRTAVQPATSYNHHERKPSIDVKHLTVGIWNRHANPFDLQQFAHRCKTPTAFTISNNRLGCGLTNSRKPAPRGCSIGIIDI